MTNAAKLIPCSIFFNVKKLSLIFLLLYPLSSKIFDKHQKSQVTINLATRSKESSDLFCKFWITSGWLNKVIEIR